MGAGAADCDGAGVLVCIPGRFKADGYKCVSWVSFYLVDAGGAGALVLFSGSDDRRYECADGIQLPGEKSGV